ncbi:MAG: CvpA family protein [Pseudomonadota bacterium]
MSGFDFIIAGIFVISVVVGLMRGFIREALSITSWIMAIWLGITFCEPAGDFIAQYVAIPADGFRVSAGFALVFILTLFAFSILSYIITKLLVKGAIKGTDRVLGIGFGVLRAGAIVIAIFLVARGMGMENSDWWKNSKYLPYFESAANYTETLLPSQLQSSPDRETPEDEEGVEKINEAEDVPAEETATATS